MALLVRDAMIQDWDTDSGSGEKWMDVRKLRK